MSDKEFDDIRSVEGTARSLGRLGGPCHIVQDSVLILVSYTTISGVRISTSESEGEETGSGIILDCPGNGYLL